jgi:uncharacterized membrane protein
MASAQKAFTVLHRTAAVLLAIGAGGLIIGGVVETENHWIGGGLIFGPILWLGVFVLILAAIVRTLGRVREGSGGRK